ncbi:hypothetical protein OG788_46100 [Streptomyces sp. NBC_00647]|uniref:hypothetical protein n=1 Tax=Streptomyces sp. NBC_00647 TaxID=2975796 RepID=UPI0032551AD7
MATAHAEAPATRADFDQYQAVVDLVNKGFADALAKILQDLSDPNHFADHVRNEAQRQGVPLEAADDTRGLFDAFWNNCTGCSAQLQWMNTAGIPERTRSYVQQIDHQPVPPANGAASRWGFSLPFGISFYT